MLKEYYSSPNSKLLSFIRENINSTSIILDVGCGIRTYQDLKCKSIISLDGWSELYPDVLVNLEEGNLPFKDKSIDTTMMIDVIEHLHKQNGFKIIKEAKRISRKNIILFTPLWWEEDPLGHSKSAKESWAYPNKYKKHISLWTKEDFKGWISIELFKDYFLGIYEQNTR